MELEHVGLINQENEKVKVVVDDYSELKKDKRYILFLKKNINGQYAIIYNNLGKYNLDNKDLEDQGRKETMKKNALKQELIQEYNL